MSPSSPRPGEEDERPLDAHETREFERIIADYRRTARRRARTGRPSPAALRWRTVVLVLLASSVFAVLSTLLPAPANLWSAPVLLVLVALASLVWAVRARRRAPGH
ncbi:hypothetical protein EV188_104531 [Actinomycetospora succinea]|uniref:DUF3040 family protein n=1 Tax=Actinomycetospora succinea TaxID=663603 RepID=A0A4R6VDH5_9PSEU|nr:hypothetical protein [Actinomycetospora succinea]TDQ58784.1 hypothetical protein EV188_104531 [Actinomycetospora succinea]